MDGLAAGCLSLGLITNALLTSIQLTRKVTTEEQLCKTMQNNVPKTSQFTKSQHTGTWYTSTKFAKKRKTTKTGHGK